MPLPLFHSEPSGSMDPHQTPTSPSACFQPFPGHQQPVGSSLDGCVQVHILLLGFQGYRSTAMWLPQAKTQEGQGLLVSCWFPLEHSSSRQHVACLMLRAAASYSHISPIIPETATVYAIGARLLASRLS